MSNVVESTDDVARGVTEIIARLRGISPEVIKLTDALVANLLMEPDDIIDLAEVIELRFSILLTIGTEFQWKTVRDVITTVRTYAKETV